VSDKLTRILVGGVLILLAAVLVQPYFNAYFFSATSSRAIQARGNLSESERETIQIFNAAAPSVVQVVGRTGSNAPARLESEEAVGVQTGTGFIWDAAGHIVTNNHVVQGTTALVVRLSTGEVGPAEVIGTAPNYDLAVVRLRNARQLAKPIAIGSSANLQVGQAAFAIGNPYGLDQSLTSGIISALKRRLPTSGGREIANVIQTDAAINPGNSGGPLLDSAGRLIGVTTAILSPSGTNAGIGFAIPIDIVNRVVPQLIRSGHVPTPGIGIVAANEAAATRLGIEGVVIVRTVPDSPAARAGLRGIDPESRTLGDVIVGANGTPIRRLADLTDQIEKIGVGHQIELSIRRDDKTITVPVQVADLSPTT
jgi:2-alkenal reductase